MLGLGLGQYTVGSSRISLFPTWFPYHPSPLMTALSIIYKSLGALGQMLCLKSPWPILS